MMLPLQRLTMVPSPQTSASSPLAGTVVRTMFTICSTDTAILQQALSSERDRTLTPTSLVALSAWAHRSTTRSSSTTTSGLRNYVVDVAKSNMGPSVPLNG